MTAPAAAKKLDRRHRWVEYVPPARAGRKGEYERLSDGLMFVSAELPFSVTGFVFCASCGKLEVLATEIQ